MLSILTSVLVFIIIIGLAITFHELGHFFAAKLSGIKVEEFAFGFGPKLWSKKIKGTEYMIKLFPLGGYVTLLGEEEEVKKEGSFSEVGLWGKILVAIGGIIMNFLLAVIVFYGVLMSSDFTYSGFPYDENMNLPFGRQSQEYAYPPLILEVVEGEGAEEAGLQEYYQITKVEGEDIESSDDLKEILSENKGISVEVEYLDENLEEGSTAVEVNSEGKIGIYHAEDMEILEVKYEGLEKYFSGFLHSINMVKANVFLIGQTINESVEERDITPVADSVSGPVGLLAITDTIRQFGGFIGLVELLGVLNIALMITNMIPFPGLDGSHVVIIIIEEIRGKPLSDKVKKIIFGVGIGILFVLAGLIAIKDVVQFGIWDWMKSLFS